MRSEVEIIPGAVRAERLSGPLMSCLCLRLPETLLKTLSSAGKAAKRGQDLPPQRRRPARAPNQTTNCDLNLGVRGSHEVGSNVPTGSSKAVLLTPGGDTSGATPTAGETHLEFG